MSEKHAIEFLEWLRLQSTVEGNSSRGWMPTNPPQGHYRAGAANALLEVIDYVERHPYIFEK